MVIGLHEVERFGSGELLWLAGFAFSDGVSGVTVVEDAPTWRVKEGHVEGDEEQIPFLIQTADVQMRKVSLPLEDHDKQYK